MVAIFKVWRQIENPTPSKKSKIQVIIQLPSINQYVFIYVKNINAKFHPDSIWNDRAFGFVWRGRPKQEQKQDE